MTTAIDQTRELHAKWWRRQNPRALYRLFPPFDIHATHRFEGEIDPDTLAGRKSMARAHPLAGDVLPAASVNYGIGFMPTLAGASYQHDGHTSWSIPRAESVAGLRVRFNPAHPLWVSYCQRYRALLARCGPAGVLPEIFALLGPMDVLAGLVGSEPLAMELSENPGEVRRAALEAAGFVNAIVDAHFQMLAEAGFADGCVTGFGYWSGGRAITMSEDFSALLGPRHFRDFFQEADGRVFSRLDNAYLHMHSAAGDCILAAIDIPGITAIEISNDPSGPGLEAVIGYARRVQAAGLAVQVSNWNHPLEDDQVRQVFDQLDPRGLAATFQARTPEHLQHLHDLVRRCIGA